MFTLETLKEAVVYFNKTPLSFFFTLSDRAKRVKTSLHDDIKILSVVPFVNSNVNNDN